MKPIEIVWSLRTRMSKKTADELFFFFLQKNVSERVCPRDILTKYFFHPKRMMISQVFICLRGLSA